MRSYDILIIGAGASGMMCGALLGKMGKRVLILDKNARPGKKLCATGNGSCNFTNLQMTPACYFGERSFIKSVLRQFTPEHAVKLFEDIGIYHKERGNYCYPQNGQASTVVEFLADTCRENGVQIFLDTYVSKTIHKKDGYEVICEDGNRFLCGILILAAGGLANPSLGGTGSGYELGRSLSHTVTRLYPGLTGLKARGQEWKQLAGVRMQGTVSLYSDGTFIKCESGEIQLVRDGISGIPVFQLCRLAAQELKKKREVQCRIDFFPELTVNELSRWMDVHGIEKLEGLVHKKWVPILKGRQGKKENSKTTARLLKAYPVVISDTFGMERAQVTAGGIDTREVDPQTMESRLHKGLYLLGELLDVDGICGGYNLHFAWATAVICSHAIAR